MNVIKSNRLKNIFFTTLSQLIVLSMAFIIPRFILVSYGSDTNGLISTIGQIMTYLSLLEAGIGQATKNELYNYIHGSVYDKENISLIMSISRYTYRKITKIYALLVIVLAVVFPFIIKTSVDYLTVFLVVLIEGFSGVITFYFVQHHADILTADGKQYINSNIDLIYKVSIYLLKLVIAFLGINIIYMEIGFFTATIMKIIIYRLYMASKYGWINYTENTGICKLNDRDSYIVTEIAWTVFSSTDMIIISIFCSTKSSSVYSIYYMIFITLNRFIEAIYQSVKYNLGQSYHNDIEEYKRTHDAFNSIFVGFISALMSTAYYLCIPFVMIYTHGIQDINYIDYTLPMGFCLIQIFSWCRMISGNLSGIAGYAKQVSKVSLIEAIINITLSLALVKTFGITGVLYATVIALILKILYCNWLADKIIMKRSINNTFIILITNIALFLLIAATKEYISIQIISIKEFIIYGILLTTVFIGLFTITNLIITHKTTSFNQILFNHKNK